MLNKIRGLRRNIFLVPGQRWCCRPRLLKVSNVCLVRFPAGDLCPGVLSEKSACLIFCQDQFLYSLLFSRVDLMYAPVYGPQYDTAVINKLFTGLGRSVWRKTLPSVCSLNPYIPYLGQSFPRYGPPSW